MDELEQINTFILIGFVYYLIFLLVQTESTQIH